MSSQAINDQIEADALKPVSANIDGNSVTKRSLDELARAADRAAAQENAGDNRPGMGLRFQKFIPYYR